MPLHDFSCKNGHTRESYVPHGVDDVPCIVCGDVAVKVFLRAPMAFVQQDVHYTSPIDGRPITSMAQRKEDLARSGCMEYDPEMKTDRLRNIKLADEALENSIGETVDATVAAMPGRKREKLSEELLRGANVVPERGVT